MTVDLENQKLKQYCRIFLYAGIGMYVLFFFIQAMGLAHNLRNLDSDATGWIASLSFAPVIIYISAFLFATGVALLAKVKGYGLVASILGFIFANSIIGAVVVFLLPDKTKQAAH